MMFFYHLGAHCTDEDRLLRCLLKNQKALAEEAIVVTGPGRFRPVLRQALSNLDGQSAPPAMQTAILEAVLDQPDPERVFFSSDGFVCVPRYVVGRTRIYPMMDTKLPRLQALFPNNPVGFSMGLRNPATLIPRLYSKMEQDIPFTTMIEAIDLPALRWSETLMTMRQAVPEAQLVVWCNEDSPLIWPEIMRAVTGYRGAGDLTGMMEFLSTIMRPEGLQRMKDYIEAHKPRTPVQRQKIIGAFLDKFAKDDVLEDEFELPGWSEDVIYGLTRDYEEDLERIAEIPGVTFIRP